MSEIEELYFQAEAEFTRMNYEAAINICQEILKEVPSNIDAVVLIAESLLRLEQYDKAVTLFTRVLNKDPDKYTLLLSLAKAYSKLEEPEKAIDYFKKYFQYNPNDIKGQLEFGEFYLDNQNYMQAKEVYKKVLNVVYDDFLARKRMGQILQIEKDYTGALEHYFIALNKQGKDPEINLFIIECYFGLKRPAKILEYINEDLVKRGLGQLITSKEMRYYHAKAYYELYDLDETIPILEAASQHYPDDPKLFHFLGGVYYLLEDYDKASKAFISAFNLSPTSSIFHKCLLYCFWKNGDQSRALESCNIGKKLSPNDFFFPLFQVILSEASGDTKEQTDALRILITSFSHIPKVWWWIGKFFEKHKQFMEAQRAYIKAFELEPKNSRYQTYLLHNLVRTKTPLETFPKYEQIKELIDQRFNDHNESLLSLNRLYTTDEYEEIEESWTELVEKYPDEKIFKFILATIELELYNYFSCMQYLDQLEKELPDIGEIQLIRTVNLFYQEEAAEASKIMRQILKSNPDRFDFLYNSAILSVERKDRYGALTQFKELLKKDPQNIFIVRQLLQIYIVNQEDENAKMTAIKMRKLLSFFDNFEENYSFILSGEYVHPPVVDKDFLFPLPFEMDEFY